MQDLLMNIPKHDDTESFSLLAMPPVDKTDPLLLR
jgi:hypothetical protein